MIFRNLSACPCLDISTTCQAVLPLNDFLSLFRFLTFHISSLTSHGPPLYPASCLHILTTSTIWIPSQLSDCLGQVPLPLYALPYSSHAPQVLVSILNHFSHRYLSLFWAKILLTGPLCHADAFLTLLRLWCSVPGCLPIWVASFPPLWTTTPLLLVYTYFMPSRGFRTKLLKNCWRVKKRDLSPSLINVITWWMWLHDFYFFHSVFVPHCLLKIRKYELYQIPFSIFKIFSSKLKQLS